jgi:DNA-binding CsgD family transcriptional regulator
MMIDSLEVPRQREVMQLRAAGYDRPEIVAILGLTYDQVRYAEEEALEVLRGRFRRAA